MFDINTKNSLAYSLIEDMYKTGHGAGLQCNHDDDSPEYKKIRQKCEAIYKLVKELDSLI